MNIDEMKSVIVYLTDKVTKLEQENIALSNKRVCECEQEEEAPIPVRNNIIRLFPYTEA
tara:strand:+ start:122 stop:298 length:177 start_codon:yes stop_codon:yes gene_type:complete